MKRRILIDGYNLIHCIPSCKQKLSQDLEGARKDLLDRLASLAARKGWEIRTVFDGGPNVPDGQAGRPRSLSPMSSLDSGWVHLSIRSEAAVPHLSGTAR